MQNKNNLITHVLYDVITGPLPYNLTNDYMFKATLQECSEARSGFIGFDMFPANNKFYDTFCLISLDSSQVYSDNFLLSVVNLKRIDEATDRDKQYNLDKWCRLITASTWEELKELVKEDPYMEVTAQKIHDLFADFEIREEARRREEYYNYVHSLEAEIAEKKADIAEKNATIAAKDAEIAELKKKLGL